VNAYNQGAGSLEARVLPQLRRLEESGGASERPVVKPDEVDVAAKRLVAPELGEAGDRAA